MSWIPPDLSSACAVYTTVTTCSPSSLLFLQMIASIFGRSRDGNRNIPDFGWSHDEKEEVFDFIVVGAGSAGCVVANRLSEIKGWKVLLLEAGEEEPDVADVPSFARMLQRSSVDWAYLTQPSPRSCLARTDGRCFWARGKVMGGSSTINYMIYTRGHPLDYDDWAAAGNPGWSYRDVLPYFIKSEDNRNLDRVIPRYHGVGGYQTVEIFPYQDQNVFTLIDGFRELGLKEFDQTGEYLIGTSLLQHTTRDGERLSTNGAFIRPIRERRRNLVVRVNSQASRVLIDKETKVAHGVEYYCEGKLRRVYARKEVILSSGSINSPQLLMLSGVGPRDELERHDIPVLQDLAVGYNLHDHTTEDGVLFAIANKSATLVDDEQRDADIRYYQQTHDGPISGTGTLQVNAFVQTKYERSGDRPDIQISFDGTNIGDFLADPILAAETNINPTAYYNGCQVRVILLNPESRGVVRLNDTDPVFGAPIIHANTFQEDIDLARMVEGIKQSLNLVRTKSLRKGGFSLVDVPLPACAHLQFNTDEYWECVLMSYTATIYHPVGTCKMGPKSDKTAVVDPKLRVYGIKNLRVVDASIMPTIVRGNTNSPTIMIGEMASDFIKSAWLKEEASGFSTDSYKGGWFY